MNLLESMVWNGTAPEMDRDNGTVRTTVEPIRDSEVATVDTDYNAVVVETTPELTGLSRSAPAADNTPSTDNAPLPYETDFTSVIDNQVATSGQAAAKESAGIRGHGTMQYDASIEPVIREGGILGGDYFMSHGAPVQDGASDYMTPTVQDNLWAATAQAQATSAARAANRASLYSGLVGG